LRDSLGNVLDALWLRRLRSGRDLRGRGKPSARRPGRPEPRARLRQPGHERQCRRLRTPRQPDARKRRDRTARVGHGCAARAVRLRALPRALPQLPIPRRSVRPPPGVVGLFRLGPPS
jgi:hypothetical protein